MLNQINPSITVVYEFHDQNCTLLARFGSQVMRAPGPHSKNERLASCVGGVVGQVSLIYFYNLKYFFKSVRFPKIWSNSNYSI